MFGMLAHATTSEYSSGSKGEHGSQNGIELCCSQWYSYPWLYVLRSKNSDDAEKIAAFMEKAVANGNIGYANTSNPDKDKRNTLFYEVLENGFKPENVNKLCSCDCSSLTYCALYNVTRKAFVSNDSWTGMSPMTRHLEYYLLTTCGGFEKLTGDAYISSSDHLKRGDILIADGHTAVWV